MEFILILMAFSLVPFLRERALPKRTLRVSRSDMPGRWRV